MLALSSLLKSGSNAAACNYHESSHNTHMTLLSHSSTYPVRRGDGVWSWCRVCRGLQPCHEGEQHEVYNLPHR